MLLNTPKNTIDTKFNKNYFNNDYNNLSKLYIKKDLLLNDLNELDISINKIEKKVYLIQKELINKTLNLIKVTFETELNLLNIDRTLVNYEMFYSNEGSKYLEKSNKIQYKYLLKFNIELLFDNNIIGIKFPIIFSKNLLILLNIDKNFEISLNFHEFEKSADKLIAELTNFLEKLNKFSKTIIPNESYNSWIYKKFLFFKIINKKNKEIFTYYQKTILPTIEIIKNIINTLKDIKINKSEIN